MKLKTLIPANWTVITIADTTTPREAAKTNCRLGPGPRVDSHSIPATHIAVRAADSSARRGLALHDAETASKAGSASRTRARRLVGKLKLPRRAADAAAKSESEADRDQHDGLFGQPERA